MQSDPDRRPKINLDVHKRPKTVDASVPDTGGVTDDPASNFDANAADLNDSSHDFDNVDSPIPNPYGEDSNNIGGDQIHIVGRTPG